MAVILICEAIPGSESFWRSFEAFETPDSDGRGQHMLHMDIRWFADLNLVDLPRGSRALSEACLDLDSKWLCEAIRGSSSACFSNKATWAREANLIDCVST